MKDSWTRPDHAALDDDEWQLLLDHFAPFPWGDLGTEPIGLDFGCGDGRFAAALSLRVARLYCLEQNPELFEEAQRALEAHSACQFLTQTTTRIPLDDESLDFAYSIGALGNLEEPTPALVELRRVLRPGAPLLLYFLYALDNRPQWYRRLWAISDKFRGAIASAQRPTQSLLLRGITLGAYYPLARFSSAAERLGLDVRRIPLSAYRRASLETMGQKVAERFTRRREQRYEREMIRALLDGAGFQAIEISDAEPYWTVLARRGEG